MASCVHSTRDWLQVLLLFQWNLICSSAYKAQLTQSIYMAGLLFGAIIFGYLADILGRVRVYLCAIVAVAIFGAVGSFSPTYWTYVGMRFLTGMHIQVLTFVNNRNFCNDQCYLRRYVRRRPCNRYTFELPIMQEQDIF